MVAGLGEVRAIREKEVKNLDAFLYVSERLGILQVLEAVVLCLASGRELVHLRLNLLLALETHDRMLSLLLLLCLLLLRVEPRRRNHL